MSELERFSGRVELRAGPCGGAGFTLVGRLAGHADEVAHLSVDCATPLDLPSELDSPVLESLGSGRWRILARGREWVLTPRAVFLHRDVARTFFKAVPQRPAPLWKRAFWRAVLVWAASGLGRRWLRRRERRAG
jgi:hypothetical protein